MEGKPTIVAITGPTCSGKSTLTMKVNEKISQKSEVIHQDHFYKPDEELEVHHGFVNWDQPTVINDTIFENTVLDKVKEMGDSSVLFIEGLFLMQNTEFLSRLKVDVAIFIYINKETCEKRRFDRDEWLRENAAYFDKVLWPSYLSSNHSILRHLSDTPTTFEQVNLPQIPFPVHVINGEQDQDSIVQQILDIVQNKL